MTDNIDTTSVCVGGPLDGSWYSSNNPSGFKVAVIPETPVVWRNDIAMDDPLPIKSIWYAPIEIAPGFSVWAPDGMSVAEIVENLLLVYKGCGPEFKRRNSHD